MGGGGWGAGFRLGVGVSHLVGSASAWSVKGGFLLLPATRERENVLTLLRTRRKKETVVNDTVFTVHIFYPYPGIHLPCFLPYPPVSDHCTPFGAREVRGCACLWGVSSHPRQLVLGSTHSLHGVVWKDAAVPLAQHGVRGPAWSKGGFSRWPESVHFSSAAALGRGEERLPSGCCCHRLRRRIYIPRNICRWGGGCGTGCKEQDWGGGGGWSCLNLATCCGIDVRRRRQLGVCSRRLLDCQTANDTRMNEGVDNNIIFAC